MYTVHTVVVTVRCRTAKSAVLPVVEKLIKDEDADVRFFSGQACSEITTVLSG